MTKVNLMAATKTYAEFEFDIIMAIGGVTRKDIFDSLDTTLNRKNVFKAG